MSEPTNVCCEAWKYLPEDTRALAIGCHAVEQAGLVPDGWTITVRHGWLTAFDDHGTMAVRIRPTDAPASPDWYGVVDIPEIREADGPADQVRDASVTQTFRRAVAKYRAARAKAA